MKSLRSPFHGRLVALACVMSALAGPTHSATAERASERSGELTEKRRSLPPSPLRSALEAEMERAMSVLGRRDVPPYFLAYGVYDTKQSLLTASFGALADEGVNQRRLLTIDLRVGDYALDNTHPIRGDMFSRFAGQFRNPVELPLEDDVDAIRAIVWRETDRRYRQAVETLAKIRTNRQVKVEEEDKSGDFSKEATVIDWEPPPKSGLEGAAGNRWKDRLKRVSGVFAGDPLVLRGEASLEVSSVRRTLVTSEGTRLQTTSTGARLGVFGETKAEDGMDLPRFETWFAYDTAGLPPEDDLMAAARSMAADLAALREAPSLDPYTGPAILAGRSAGVFFHEIFGHRLEGHRQKDEEEAQTFTKMVGEKVLPEFVDVIFDPTRRTIDSEPAAGHYRYDDEGVRAHPVTVVKDGVLKSFLMSRSPVEGFPRSNGHGRAQAGLAPVGRQSNLIVESNVTKSADALRGMLLEEARAQDREFGLWFEDIAGGFTFTGRGTPNAFAVLPVMVWKVFVDGRPDELVRGADLIGTPLTSFSRIVAAGDDRETFNGMCGAESGWVPVSASSPSLLIGQIEVQKKEKSSERPPILPAPMSPAKEREAGRRESDEGTAAPLARAKVPDEPVFSAMRDELLRAARDLQIEENPPPYYASATVSDVRWATVTAVFGAVTQTFAAGDRQMGVSVRIGDRKLDSSRFVRREPSFRFGWLDPPEEDDERELRRVLWQSLDESYKDAVENLARKKAVLESTMSSDPDALPDFSIEEPVIRVLPTPPPEFDRAAWEERVSRLSAVFREFPRIHSSSVRVSWALRDVRRLDTEGSVARHPREVWIFEARAETQAGDGMPLSDFVSFYAPHPSKAPGDEELAGAVREMARRLSDRLEAPALESAWSGPVLLEDQAVAEFFFALAGRSAAIDRDPVFEDARFGSGFGAMSMTSPWKNRTGSRVAADFLQVLDDPTMTEFQGTPLIGAYAIDDEGVPSQRVRLIENGRLRGVLATRTPVKSAPKSNGHARGLSGLLAQWMPGAKPFPGVLIVEATPPGIAASGERSRPMSVEAVREKFLKTLKDRGLSHGYVVRRVDNAIANPPGEDGLAGMMAAMMRGQAPSALADPIEIVRISAEGEETPVRGARWDALDVRVLKDVLAASSGPGGRAAHNFRASPMSGLPGLGPSRGAGATALPVSVVAPRAVLLEDAELAPATGPYPTLPVLSHPSFPGGPVEEGDPGA